jgi:hypothetical protein
MVEPDTGAAPARRSRRAPTRRPRELVDPAAAAKRVAERTDRVSAGLSELERWLLDQMRGGLAALEHAGYPQIDRVAARMIDAQAPGVASLLRAIPGELAVPGWPGRVLEHLAGIFLLVRAHQRLDELPADLQATVRSRVGYPIAKADVLAGHGVADRWLAVGMIDTVEFRLETRRVWLYGLTTGRWGLWLNFAPPGGYLDATVMPGETVDAELHFYPGSGQYRALIGRPAVVEAPADRPALPAGEALIDVQRRFAELLAADPWATRMPAVIDSAPVVRREGEGWLLRDRAGAACELTGPSAEPWTLLAHSAGEPVPVFGEWDGRFFRPLSVLGVGRPFGSAWYGRAA